MYFIAAFGLLLFYFSVFMVLKPQVFSQGIITFSEKTYFHPFEIISRLLSGAAFVYYSPETLFPGVFSFIGYVLMAVGGGLLCTPPALHKKYAVWAAIRFKTIFRPAGLVSAPMGILMVYCAVAKSTF